MAAADVQQPPAKVAPAEPAPALPDYLVSPNAVFADSGVEWRYGKAPDYSKTRKVWEEGTHHPSLRTRHFTSPHRTDTSLSSCQGCHRMQLHSSLLLNPTWYPSAVSGMHATPACPVHQGNADFCPADHSTAGLHLLDDIYRPTLPTLLYPETMSDAHWECTLTCSCRQEDEPRGR